MRNKERRVVTHSSLKGKSESQFYVAVIFSFVGIISRFTGIRLIAFLPQVRWEAWSSIIFPFSRKLGWLFFPFCCICCRWSLMRKSSARRSATPSRTFTESGTSALRLTPYPTSLPVSITLTSACQTCIELTLLIYLPRPPFFVWVLWWILMAPVQLGCEGLRSDCLPRFAQHLLSWSFPSVSPVFVSHPSGWWNLTLSLSLCVRSVF